ncbi:long-chain fatty acid transporter [Sulfuriferula sp. AH1]|uniref:OmpP1/FadL family transporter n=1 Tax=Sulfuriferula sp. AH1 TaxID=1985873 RepID=UPI000B3B2C0D|nr:outer membrane protein transport protein [Sulfuriferula sp. AH1]ARU30554.1 long-chain fatty acid transporter [Sulfuriferula sp. AH1]
MKLKKLVTVMAVAGITLPGAAMATNGMFSSGYGMVANGMGGAATAMSEDAFGGANNPASMVFVGDRIDFGASLFSPRREASNAGGAFGNVVSESDSNYFAIPEFGYNKMMNPNLSLGVSVYGNGGMNTDYPALSGMGTTNILGGSGSLGVDLMQLIVAPTAAFKITPNHSIGISPLLGYQRFKAQGLQGFTAISTDPTHVTNNGYDDAFGAGVRVGYMGKITPQLTIGLAYSSKVDMQKMKKYAGLFAEQGNLDLPENYDAGVAYKFTPDLTVALDYQRINYSGVAAIGNASIANLANGLGSNNGSGFGWHDIDVWKLGAEYKYNKNWIMRAGWNHGDNPVQSADVTFNILAPGVIKDHLTMGTTYTTSTGGELTVAYTHGFENSVSGPRPAAFGGGTDTIRMHQDILGIAYGWKM